MNKNRLPMLTTALVALSLSACGGGGSDSPDGHSSSSTGTSSSSSAGNSSSSGSTETHTGVFTDSPVAGVAYTTETRNGTTSANGEFEYVEGETINFSVGGINFPPVSAKSRVTPLDMGGEGADLATPQVVNILRLLQTLDDDGDPENGITVSANTANALADVAFSFGDGSFEAEAPEQIADHLGRELVAGDDAVAHFEGALKTDILGSWLLEDENGGEVVLTFIDDSTYVLAHASDGGQEQVAAAAEVGTYSWNPVTGLFSVIDLLYQSDGSGGLYDPDNTDLAYERALYIDGSVLTLELEDETVQATAVASDNHPLVGAWRLSEEAEQGAVNHNLLTFYSPTHYVISHTYNEESYDGDAVERAASEWSAYTWDSDSGEFSVTDVSAETDGDGGLYNRTEDQLTGRTITAEANGDLEYSEEYGQEVHTATFARVGVYPVELKDVEGDTRTAHVRRQYGRFSDWQGATYEIANILAGQAGSYELNTGNEPTTFSLPHDGESDMSWPSEDGGSSIVSWDLSSSGVLHFTEEDDWGDRRFWRITPIAGRSGNAALVEIQTPAGQSDAADLRVIADLVRVPEQIQVDVTATIFSAESGEKFSRNGGAATLQCGLAEDQQIGEVWGYEEIWELNADPAGPSTVDSHPATYDPTTGRITSSGNMQEKEAMDCCESVQMYEEVTYELDVTYQPDSSPAITGTLVEHQILSWDLDDSESICVLKYDLTANVR